MKSISITLPDGSIKTYPQGTTAAQVAGGIGKRLEDAAIAAIVDGKVVDLNRPIANDCKLSIVTKDSKEGLEVLRHSTAHLLAQAIKELYPAAQITIGPVIDDGFYYDIDAPTPLTPEDLPKLEKKMEEIAARKLEVTRGEIPRDKAVTFFKEQKEFYKAEIIEGLSENVVSIYTQGNFTDLCRGPHVPNTAKLGKFKLLSLAGAYWRGDEKNKMLQRIYGTAFASQKELEEHLKRIEEAKKRDHRKLGPELGLFTFHAVAPAMPFYLPNGAQLLETLQSFMRKDMRKNGYHEVVCPQLMSTQLWETSGHMGHYKDNMFFSQTADEHLMALKPMNCPGHMVLYGTTKHSYRELPLRYAEFSKLHRYERAGVTHGLFRTRTFSQDDGHIFLMEDQIGAEALALIRNTRRIYEMFGFRDVNTVLATRPDDPSKYAGTIENWDKATRTLEETLKEAGENFTIAHGDGAFYGPKIEFHIKDSLNRSWQCGTIQLDFLFPERFQLEYVAADGKAKRPVVIHRAIFGSFERFLGILIEHYAGHFPLWLAPTQAIVLNVTDAQTDYVKSVGEALTQLGMRVRLDLSNEKLGYKIREAQLQRIPLMIVLGNKEMESKTLSVRKVSGETTNDLTLSAFEQSIRQQLNPGGLTH